MILLSKSKAMHQIWKCANLHCGYQLQMIPIRALCLICTPYSMHFYRKESWKLNCIEHLWTGGFGVCVTTTSHKSVQLIYSCRKSVWREIFSRWIDWLGNRKPLVLKSFADFWSLQLEKCSLISKFCLEWCLKFQSSFGQQGSKSASRSRQSQ